MEGTTLNLKIKVKLPPGGKLITSDLTAFENSMSVTPELILHVCDHSTNVAARCLFSLVEDLEAMEVWKLLHKQATIEVETLLQKV